MKHYFVSTFIDVVVISIKKLNYISQNVVKFYGSKRLAKIFYIIW